MTTNIETYLNSLSEDILTLDIKSRGLKYLPDLTRFKNLQVLICYDNKLMTSLRCKHELCWTCWSSFCKSKEDSEIRASCPLCRCDKW